MEQILKAVHLCTQLLQYRWETLEMSAVDQLIQCPLRLAADHNTLRTVAQPFLKHDGNGCHVEKIRWRTLGQLYVSPKLVYSQVVLLEPVAVVKNESRYSLPKVDFTIIPQRPFHFR